jgi:hypothetical protein
MDLGRFLESVTNRVERVQNWLRMKQTEKIELGIQGQKAVPWRTYPAIDENAWCAAGRGHVQSYWSGNLTYPMKGYIEGQVDRHLVHGYVARNRDMN